jgi:dTDP-4-amino-4,6-dideoxygalactose transaminase
VKNVKIKADLAINGASPLFREPKVVGYPYIGNREKYFEMLNDIFDRNWLTNNGVYIQEFSKKLSDYLEVKHVIPVCNATVGLEIAAKVLELNGEVLVPSYTFIATVHILQWLGIKPIFVDIDPKTHCIDPVHVEKLITQKTTGILGVHVWGNACNIEALQAIADKHHLKVFYDAAHAFGCSHKGRMIGNFGCCEVFSFHATKIFNTFEGGAITTNDDELAEKIRKAINFGFVGPDKIIRLGMNGKMSEASGAMGLINLAAFPQYVECSKKNHELYRKMFKGIDGIEIMSFDSTEKYNYHYIVAQINEEVFGISRDRLYNILHAENVMVRRYFNPGCHNSEPYLTLYPGTGASLPVTNSLCRSVLVFPNHGMNEEDIGSLSCLIESLEKGDF